MFRLFVFWFVAIACAAAPALRAQDDPASRHEAIQAMYPIMIEALEAKAFGRARNICEQAIMWEPQNSMHHYNLGCIEAQAGRLPQAFGALDLAVALGFNDPRHFQNDPDLAPLHGDPRFAELVRKVTNNAFGANTQPVPKIPQVPTNLVPPRPGLRSAPETKASPPADTAFEAGRPIGLFFMMRAQAGRLLEKAVWYFAPDGTVYQDPEVGFSAADLAAHAGAKGQCSVVGGQMVVTWSDGKKTSSPIKLSANHSAFSWNAGNFFAVKPFATAAELAGTYEGEGALSSDAALAKIANRLELRADGTFSWHGATFAQRPDQGAIDLVPTGDCSGRWALQSSTLFLSDTRGITLQRIIFPARPDGLVLGRLLFKKR